MEINLFRLTKVHDQKNLTSSGRLLFKNAALSAKYRCDQIFLQECVCLYLLLSALSAPIYIVETKKKIIQEALYSWYRLQVGGMYSQRHIVGKAFLVLDKKRVILSGVDSLWGYGTPTPQ